VTPAQLETHAAGMDAAVNAADVTNPAEEEVAADSPWQTLAAGVGGSSSKQHV
jgi:hypothetical protein